MLKMRHAMAVIALAVAASITSGSAGYQDRGYTIVDLGPLGAGGSAESINSRGDVAGYSYKAGDPVVHATLWDSAGVHDLLTLGGSESEAYAVNASGQVVGFSYIAGNQVHRATLWDSSGPHDLGTIGGSKAIAYAINGIGQIVGSSDISGDAFHRATLWDSAGPRDLGTLGGPYSVAYGINDAGTVVGHSWLNDHPDFHATLWDSTGPRDLGTLGGPRSNAFSINASGQVVGLSYTDGGVFHATVWDSLGPYDLGTLGGSLSVAYGINDAGQIVGASYGPSGSGYLATLWNPSQGPIDLNTLIGAGELGWELTEATGINSAGQIVGNGSLNGVRHAFLLTPVAPPNAPPVADAGPDETSEVCAGPSGASVALDGSRSSDADGDGLSYTWTGAFGTVQGVMPVILLSPGVHTVTLTVDDGRGGTDSDSVDVTVPPLSFAGFLAPVGGADATGGSFNAPLRVLRLGSPLPIKFRAACNGTSVTTGMHTLKAIRYTSETTADAPINARSTDAAATGNQFRFVDGQWHFNLDTRATGLDIGIWRLLARLVDGSEHSVWIQIR